MTRNVLVSGAGPTGLIAAISLVKQGIEVRIIDKAETTASTSRAVIMHARILELYQQLGLTDEIVAAGHKLEALNFWSNGVRKVRIPLAEFGQGISRYPFALVLPQDIHEHVLEQKLKSLGVGVERQTELLDFTDHGSHVTARIRRSDGSEEAFDAAYILGCDGAHSAVRHSMYVDFEGDAYKQLFCLADVSGSGTTINGEMHVSFLGGDFILSIAYNQNSRVRLIETVGNIENPDASDITFDSVRPLIEKHLNMQVSGVNWFTTYRVHHRVAAEFRKSRAFLLGDAAHIHSPVGGQGMNTGIGDAINLAWKLASVLKGKANDTLLETYEIERKAFAKQLVATTDRAFTLILTQGFLADFIRNWAFPAVASIVFRFTAVGQFMFRTVSQTQLNYCQSPLAGGEAMGKVRAGERLPWAVGSDGDNYSTITEIKWQVHVYEPPKEPLVEWCRTNKIDLHHFDWDDSYQKAGLVQNAVYLLRPDSYVAMVVPQDRISQLDEYFRDHSLEL